MAEQSPSDPHAQALAPLRAQIDELDRQIVELLNQRAGIVVQVGKIKQQNKTPIYQPDREKEVLENAERNNRGPLTDAAIRRLFERIIDEARAAERSAMHQDGAKKDS